MSIALSEGSATFIPAFLANTIPACTRRKRQEGKSHTVAVRALANLWVRILSALWRDHVPYDPAIFLAAQHAHGRQAA